MRCERDWLSLGLRLIRAACFFFFAFDHLGSLPVQLHPRELFGCHDEGTEVTISMHGWVFGAIGTRRGRILIFKHEQVLLGRS